MRFIRRAEALQFVKITDFDEFSHCYNAFIEKKQGLLFLEVQGFGSYFFKILAPEQIRAPLNALLFKGFGFVQYALQ